MPLASSPPFRRLQVQRLPERGVPVRPSRHRGHLRTRLSPAGPSDGTSWWNLLWNLLVESLGGTSWWNLLMLQHTRSLVMVIVVALSWPGATAYSWTPCGESPLWVVAAQPKRWHAGRFDQGCCIISLTPVSRQKAPRPQRPSSDRRPSTPRPPTRNQRDSSSSSTTSSSLQRRTGWGWKSATKETACRWCQTGLRISLVRPTCCRSHIPPPRACSSFTCAHPHLGARHLGAKAAGGSRAGWWSACGQGTGQEPSSGGDGERSRHRPRTLHSGSTEREPRNLL